MEVTNAEGARELVMDWIRSREGDRLRLGLPTRPLMDCVVRFNSWASDQRTCAAYARMAGDTEGAAGHEAAAAVLDAAAIDAQREP